MRAEALHSMTPGKTASRSRKATAKKATAKKSTSKKSTAKKSTSKKSTAKKSTAKAATRKASAPKSGAKPKGKANAKPKKPAKRRLSPKNRFAAVMERLDRSFGALHLPETTSTLEKAVYLVLRENGTENTTDRALKSLREDFVDWNEVRVSQIGRASCRERV